METVIINNQRYSIGKPVAIMRMYNMEGCCGGIGEKLSKPQYIILVNGAWRLLEQSFILTKNHKDGK